MMVKMVLMMKKEVREEVKSQRRSGTTTAITIPNGGKSGVRRLHRRDLWDEANPCEATLYKETDVNIVLRMKIG